MLTSYAMRRETSLDRAAALRGAVRREMLRKMNNFLSAILGILWVGARMKMMKMEGEWRRDICSRSGVRMGVDVGFVKRKIGRRGKGS
jgi:hypothetical protein